MKNRIIVLSSIVLGLWLAGLVLPLILFCKPEHRGQFGDQFGAVNALFSGLAFAAIFGSLYAQQEESSRQEKRFTSQLAADKANTAKQLDLEALTSYANLTLALFLNNEKKASAFQTSSKEYADWMGKAEIRHKEMVKAKDAFEKLLKEANVLT